MVPEPGPSSFAACRVAETTERSPDLYILYMCVLNTLKTPNPRDLRTNFRDTYG